MPHYYFHIRSRDRRIEDLEGGEFDTLSAALKEARLAAREMLANDIRQGRIDETRLFEIVDEQGQLVASLPFGKVLD